ncbi:hypothetical protein PQR14_11860 [Paraburkholderia bryophila]|jgi:hypothetical protein
MSNSEWLMTGHKQSPTDLSVRRTPLPIGDVSGKERAATNQ